LACEFLEKSDEKQGGAVGEISKRTSGNFGTAEEAGGRAQWAGHQLGKKQTKVAAKGCAPLHIAEVKIDR
jgi:hypothetical protein